jgi:hypothetical protein
VRGDRLLFIMTMRIWAIDPGLRILANLRPDRDDGGGYLGAL